MNKLVKDSNFISIQKFIDKKVIDNNGTLVGEVKDLKVKLGQLDIELIIATKTGEEMDIPWSDIQSVEDFIILKKTVKLPKSAAAPTPQPSDTTICKNCGVETIKRAKFCPKCGSDLK